MNCQALIDAFSILVENDDFFFSICSVGFLIVLPSFGFFFNPKFLHVDLDIVAVVVAQHEFHMEVVEVFENLVEFEFDYSIG